MTATPVPGPTPGHAEAVLTKLLQHVNDLWLNPSGDDTIPTTIPALVDVLLASLDYVHARLADTTGLDATLVRLLTGYAHRIPVTILNTVGPTINPDLWATLTPAQQSQLILAAADLPASQPTIIYPATGMIR